MKFLESIKLALNSLRANKMRSVLTLLGIIIGVASVIAMVSMGEGASRMIQGEISGLGANLVWVQPDYRSRDVQQGRFKPLTIADAERIRAAVPELAEVSPWSNNNATIGYRNRHEDVTIQGTNASYVDLRDFNVAEGRFFLEGDVKAVRRVAVLGSDLAEKLFKDQAAAREKAGIGQMVKIDSVPFLVIGVLAKVKESVGDGTSPNMGAFIPITRMLQMTGNDYITVIFGQAGDAQMVPRAMTRMESVLRLKYGNEYKYMISSQESTLEFARTITAVFTAILAGIGSISLIVGGIGVMNIMLVSVTERTREIGIRKALGGRRSDILRQFLIEAVTLCLLGGIIGIILGVSGSALISAFAPWPPMVSGGSIVLAFGFSTAIGLIFGVYPAYKAAGLDPIEALRYE